MTNLNPLMEWAVWGNIDKHSDIELILLKGHLYLELVLDSILLQNKFKQVNNLSFHRKIQELKNIETSNEDRAELLVCKLNELNQLRNKLAHEWRFDIHNGEFELWSLSVLENFNGTKFTKFTYRTKIKHAFSILTINILEHYDKK